MVLKNNNNNKIKKSSNTDYLAAQISLMFTPSYKNRSSILLWNVTAVYHKSGGYQVKGRDIFASLCYSHASQLGRLACEGVPT